MERDLARSNNMERVTCTGLADNAAGGASSWDTVKKVDYGVSRRKIKINSAFVKRHGLLRDDARILMKQKAKVASSARSDLENSP